MQKILLAIIASAVVAAMLPAFGTLAALATPSPTGSGNSGCAQGAATCPGPGNGQPGSGPSSGGAGSTLCQNGGNAQMTPGNPSPTGGGTHNPDSSASANYAGQDPSTHFGNGGGSANANSPHAVSQYDVSCFQQTSNPGHP